MPTAPHLDLDPFADDFIRDPYEHYRAMRDAGPVIQLSRYDVHAVARFDSVRTTMRDRKRFQSAKGPGFNAGHNERMQGTVVASEPPEHTQLRSTIVRRLNLERVQEQRPVADTLAHKFTAQFLERGTFDAAADLARPFVSAFVASVLGISHEVAELAIDGSMAGFNSVGPVNERTVAAEPVLDALFAKMAHLTKQDFQPGSIGREVLEAHERGEVPFATSLSLIFNFLGPAFDTTINAMGLAVWLLANHPGQWSLLRENPELIPSAINECLRLESPLQAWSRWCADGAVIDDIEIPPGTRVAVFPGSANRDERHYTDPETFDIARNPADHLGFGQGIHTCLGAPLARMELTSVLTAFTTSVHSLQPAGDAEIRLNNTTRGLRTAPVSIA